MKRQRRKMPITKSTIKKFERLQKSGLTHKEIQKIDWDLAQPISSEPYRLRRTRCVG